MKHGIKICLLIVIVFVVNVAYGQQQKKLKFGHINSTELFKIMPGKDSAQAKIQDYAKSVESQYKTMQAEFENKYQDFLANQATMSALIQQTKTKELQDLQARIEAFQASASEDMQTKQDEILAPIINKAKKAIEDVAKEGEYTYIFDSGNPAMLFAEPSDDIMLQVKKKLGIN